MILTMNLTKQTKIAVVGVSHDPQKYGAKIFKDLVAADYNVVGVNPKGGIVAAQPLFVSLKEIKPKPDLVITVVPPKATLEVVKICFELGIKTIWMQPGSESQDAIELAQQHGLTVVSQACFMVQQKLW